MDNKNPDLRRIPPELTQSLMNRIMLTIPPGAGEACSDEATWTKMRTPLTHLVEAVLLAQKELYDADKEARREEAGAGPMIGGEPGHPPSRG